MEERLRKLYRDFYVLIDEYGYDGGVMYSDDQLIGKVVLVEKAGIESNMMFDSIDQFTDGVVIDFE